MGKEFFKVSSGLKTLMGSELITDKFIAVFELVKNAFDANAKTVNITFQDLHSHNPKIIIVDNGKGMDYDDLINKWLFVAYSAKKDGTEDGNASKPKRNFYAGAKGVGRFSCDRLGRYLNLISIKDSKNARIENLNVDWTTFERDQKEEFIKIPIEHTVLSTTSYDIPHGTILEISGFETSEWDREDLIRLKDRLSKLIRPDLTKFNRKKDFFIKLSVPDELNRDHEEIQKAALLDEDEREGYIYRHTVNSDVQNIIFDELDIRTTKIESTISNDGTITTKLTDRGDFIYEIREKNIYPLLKDVSITLYFLNRSSKMIFTRRMGVEPINYGHLFVYKNGFRINPYGDRGDDSFGIATRAAQGYARFLSPRNLIGQIDVQGENPELRETTSRAGGFVKTQAYYQLANTDDGFLIKTLRRLEKFVTEVIDWGISDDSFISGDSEKNNENLVKHISNIFDDKNLLAIKYNQDLINLLEQKEEKSAKKLVKNFKRLAAESNDPKLIKDAAQIEKTIVKARKETESAEKESEKEREQRLKVQEELEQQVGETNFARAVVGADTKELISIQHHIHRHSAQHISALLDKLIDAINRNAAKEKLLDLVNKAILANKKIITLSKFVTKATFDTTTERIRTDLVNFVNEYVINVYLEFKRSATNDQKLSIQIANPDNVRFEIDLQPIDMIIILDNLLNNSFKANAHKIKLHWEKIDESHIALHIIDDGIGIPNENLNKIFEFRFTTTSGSGLGLYHTKQVIERMGGSIFVNNSIEKGAEFILKFKK